MPGGAVGNDVIVDLSRLSQIEPVDLTTKAIRVGPGAICAQVNAKAGENGLRFPVDPSSTAFCTLGGMAATNAAGAHTLLFGATRSWVNGLDCVFADGTRAWIRRGKEIPPNIPVIGSFLHNIRPHLPDNSAVAKLSHPGVRKDSSGYGIRAYAESGELIDLLVGSEGTLAVFVGIELRLEAIAGAVSGVIAEFHDFDSAVEAAIVAARSGASACELLDRTFLELVNPADAPEAVLLCEVEAVDEPGASDHANLLAATFEGAGAANVRIALSPTEQREMWDLRHAASPILFKLNPALKPMQFVEDGAVPPEKLGDYVNGLRSVFAAHGLRGVIFGHAGDAHVHANPFIDTSRPDWREIIVKVLDEVVSLTAELGGTVAGEHGDGRLRAPYLDRIWSSEAMELFRRIKECFDPRGILNPGVKLTATDNISLGDIKYDPSLPDLPEKIRAELDSIAAERGYDRFRLSLVEEAG